MTLEERVEQLEALVVSQQEKIDEQQTKLDDNAYCIRLLTEQASVFLNRLEGFEEHRRKSAGLGSSAAIDKFINSQTGSRGFAKNFKSDPPV